MLTCTYAMGTTRGTQCNVQRNVILYSRLEIENTFEACNVLCVDFTCEIALLCMAIMLFCTPPLQIFKQQNSTVFTEVLLYWIELDWT